MSELAGFSLQKRLTWLLLGLTLLLWAGSVAFIFWMNHRESQAVFDRSLTETAHLLVSIAPLTAQEQTQMPVQEQAAGQHVRSLIFQIWRHDGRLIYASHGATTQPLRSMSNDGLDWLERPDGRWRVYSVWDQKRQYQVQIGDRWQLRAEFLNEMGEHLLITTLFFIPWLWLGLRRLIQRSFTPINALASRLQARTAQDLDPIETSGLPQEILPLLAAFNALLIRVEETLKRERRFTADAAHELRTPLAAIRLHAQVLRKARHPQEAEEALLDIQQGIDWATRMIEQLLTLARLEPSAMAPDHLSILALDQQITAVLRLLPALKQPIELDLSSVQVWANAGGLEIMLRNLIDNASRYSPIDGTIYIRCYASPQSGQAILEVCDQGPGISPELRQRVFDRFYRIPGTEATGSGLGLSIVQRIMMRHQGTVHLLDRATGPGLCVQLQFKLA